MSTSSVSIVKYLEAKNVLREEMNKLHERFAVSEAEVMRNKFTDDEMDTFIEASICAAEKVKEAQEMI